MRQVHRFKTKIIDRYVRIDCIGSEWLVLNCRKVDVVALAGKETAERKGLQMQINCKCRYTEQKTNTYCPKRSKTGRENNFNFCYSLCLICYQFQSQGPLNRAPNASVYESVKQSIWGQFLFIWSIVFHVIFTWENEVGFWCRNNLTLPLSDRDPCYHLSFSKHTLSSSC